MNNSNNKNVTSGVAGIVAIILFVTGVVFNQLPIEILRPKGAEMKSLEVKAPQDVEARLWQDPFSAAKNSSESEKKENIPQTHVKEEHEIEALKNDITKHLTGDKIVTVLGVMVNAGPYAEYAESRRRMRYAVLAGLANENYVPEDGEHIGYIQESNNGSPKLPEIIPFEWLHVIGPDGKKRKHQILILWIAENNFQDNPYKKLLSLFESLKCGDCNKNNYKVKILGPSDSDVLRKITRDKYELEQIKEMEIESEKIELEKIELIRFLYYRNYQFSQYDINLDNELSIEFYSATTTVDTKFILNTSIRECDLRLMDASDSNPESEIIDQFREKFEPKKNECAVLIVRAADHSEKWTLAGFDDAGEFRKVIIDNGHNSELSEELKKGPGSERRIIKLATPKLGRTQYEILKKCGKYNLNDEEDQLTKIRCIFNDRLFRTIHSDNKLAETLIEELVNKRNIDLEQDKILLLSEWDTFYGRYLPNTIGNAIKVKYKDKYRSDSEELKKKLKEMLPRYTYLRGLDGDIPAAKNEKDKQDKQRSETAVDQQFSKERPEGTSQLDYITRLADEIVAEIEDNNLKGKDNKFKAIGLLGSDADDKLILLQALRPRLPGMVFFTTDMDARLIPHGSHDWSRNLIVASSFGLNLNKSYQGSIPPFRDAYQTAIFLATQLAVCNINTETGIGSDAVLDAKHDLLDTWLGKPPRLFEIGHTEAFNITDTKPIDKQESEQVCSLLEKKVLQSGIEIPELNPSIPPLFPREKVIVILTIMSILVLLMISVTLKNNPLDTIRSMVGLFEISLVKILLFLATILAIILGYIIITNMHEIYEPFLWFQGISIWPTQIIRFLAIILSLCFLGYSWRIIKKDQDDLEKNFFNYDKENTLLICPRTIENIFYLKKLGDKNSPQSARKIFSRYLHKSRLNYRLIRTFIFLALFVGFSFLLFFELFPVPDPPARGQATFIIIKVLLVASILSFWFLLFFIADAFRFSERFLYDMTYYTTEWPGNLINHYTSQSKIPDEPNTKGPIRTNNDLINDWLELEVAAIHTESILKLIWYPFIILILLISSINHFFDNWAYPRSIIIVIVFAFIILIFYAWKLQRAAEKLRSDALDHLYRKLIWAEGDKSLSATADQLKLLIEQVNNLRRGAFQSFLQRPFMKSILTLLSSVGVLQLLEYFYR
ncbi:MAG: hypothetical protein U1F76_27510 [Candidatus Competibacteraceae bacterium]